MNEVIFRRLNWNSPWMFLGAPGIIACFGLLVFMLWNGYSAGPLLCGLVLVASFGTIPLYCLERVVITEQSILLKIGPTVLRRIPIDQIRTITSTSISIGKSNSCCESLIFLSPKRADELTHGVGKPSRESICAYFESKMILHFLQPQEGLWLSYSDSRAEQIAKMIPNADNYLMNHERS